MPHEGQELHGQDGCRLQAGAARQMGSEPPARGRRQARPALRTAAFFQRLHDGAVPADFLERFSAEVRFA